MYVCMYVCTRTNIRTVANDLTQLETGSTCVRLMGRSRGSIVVAHDTYHTGTLERRGRGEWREGGGGDSGA